MSGEKAMCETAVAEEEPHKRMQAEFNSLNTALAKLDGILTLIQEGHVPQELEKQHQIEVGSLRILLQHGPEQLSTMTETLNAKVLQLQNLLFNSEEL